MFNKNNSQMNVHWFIKLMLLTIAFIGFYTFFTLLFDYIVKNHTNCKLSTELLFYTFIGISASILLSAMGHIGCLVPT